MVPVSSFRTLCISSKKKKRGRKGKRKTTSAILKLYTCPMLAPLKRLYVTLNENRCWSYNRLPQYYGDLLIQGNYSRELLNTHARRCKIYVTPSNRDGDDGATHDWLANTFLAARGWTYSREKSPPLARLQRGKASKNAKSRNVLRAQVRHSCASNSLRNAPRFHVVIHYAPRQLSADAYTRDCIRGERARTHTYTRTRNSRY